MGTPATGAEICRAVKRNGERCTHRAKFAGFCGKHLPKPAGPTQETPKEDPGSGMWSKSLKVVEGIAALGGAIELVKLVVQAWQSVAFGPGSPMPREYELLAAEFGSPWGLSFYRYYPSNTKIGHEFWVKTYQIWQKSKDALAELSDKPERVGEISTRIGAIEADLNELFDSMNDTMRNMVCDYLGDDGLEEEGDHSDESGEGGRMTMM